MLIYKRIGIIRLSKTGLKWRKLEIYHHIEITSQVNYIEIYREWTMNAKFHIHTAICKYVLEIIGSLVNLSVIQVICKAAPITKRSLEVYEAGAEYCWCLRPSIWSHRCGEEDEKGTIDSGHYKLLSRSTRAQLVLNCSHNLCTLMGIEIIISGA